MILMMPLVALAEDFRNPGRLWTQWGHSESEAEMKTQEPSLLTLKGQKERFSARWAGRILRTSLFWVSLLIWQRHDLFTG